MGIEAVKDFIDYLSNYSKILKQQPDWEWNNLRKIEKIDSYISFLKTTPWNEGGYCQDDLE